MNKVGIKGLLLRILMPTLVSVVGFASEVLR